MNNYEIESILEYNNCYLYLQDLNYFQEREWLNDNCIHFIFKWFQFTKYSLNSSSSSLVIKNHPYLFLDPSVVSYIRLQVLDQDDINDLYKGLKFSSKQYLFIPCNNQSSFHLQSIHWSLLVIDMLLHQVYSLDSSYPFNSSTIEILTQILCLRILGWETLPPIIHIDCPQQSNSYDCGIYTVLYADKIASVLFSNYNNCNDDNNNNDIDNDNNNINNNNEKIICDSNLITEAVSSIKSKDCPQFRKYMLEVIHNLITESKKK